MGQKLYHNQQQALLQANQPQAPEMGQPAPWTGLQSTQTFNPNSPMGMTAWHNPSFNPYWGSQMPTMWPWYQPYQQNPLGPQMYGSTEQQDSNNGGMNWR